jgi:FMN-dependent NADH-azoreductase
VDGVERHAVSATIFGDRNLNHPINQILVVEVSPRGAASASRAVSRKLLTQLHARFPQATIIHRDLDEERLPHLDDAVIMAITSKNAAVVRAHRESARLSDVLTDEVLASDLLVIATPMWNFGIPSLLKAWIDLIVRPGRTFNYAEDGVIGLAKGKRAILILASGGVFTDGPWKPWDFVEPYLRRILGFIGIDDVHTVRVEGTNIPPLAGNAIPAAEKTLESIPI